MDRFKPLPKELMEERLALPGKGRLRLLIDTDTANEIDDQYALAWAMLAPERFDLVAVTAEPFSFAHHRPELLAIEKAKEGGKQREGHFVGGFQGWVDRLHAQGRKVEDLRFVGPAEGVELSLKEILTVYEKVGIDGKDRSFLGAPAYMESPDEPIRSDAVDAIIDCAKSSDGPLYVAAMGCVTNVASAFLVAPEIRENTVVVWTSGYPSTSPHSSRPSLNLVQDVHASRLLFDCGAPVVYLPGYHVGAQLKISLPEMERFVKGRGAIGDYLFHLYTNNPLHELFAISGAERRTWVIWDVIDIAWLLNPAWVPTHMTNSPVLDDGLKLCQDPSRHAMREGHDVQRDEIFLDLYDRLEKSAG